VRKMSDIEAGSIAARIVGMLAVLARQQQQQVQRGPMLRAVGED